MFFNDGSHDLQKFPWSRFTFSTATFFSICPSLPTSFASLQFSSSISNSWSGIGRSLLKRIPIKQTLEAVIVPFSFPHVGRFHLFSSHSHFASSLHLAVMPHPGVKGWFCMLRLISLPDRMHFCVTLWQGEVLGRRGKRLNWRQIWDRGGLISYLVWGGHGQVLPGGLGKGGGG